MPIAALIAWLLTASGGFLMLGTWMSRGGHRAGTESRLSGPLVFGHFGLTVVGLALWIIYVVNDSHTLGWICFVLLLAATLGGLAMLARWIPIRREDRPESHFPLPVVALHGVLAAVTLVLVLLATLDIGE